MRTPLRVLTALAVAITAALHLFMYLEWASGIFPLGAAFVAQGVLGLVLAVVLLTVRGPLVLWGALVYGLGSVAAFFLSSVTGFLGVMPQLVGWQEWVSKCAELLAALLAAAALVAERGRTAS